MSLASGWLGLGIKQEGHPAYLEPKLNSIYYFLKMLSSEIEDFDQTLTKLEFGHIPIFLIISK